MKKENLSLIGCGWLGKELALDLKSQNYEFIATTAHDKSEEFTLSAVPYTQLDAALDIVPESILKSDVLIYMVPPLAVSHVKHFFDQIPIEKKIIFISSTSVYGKNLGVVDEKTEHHVCSTSSPLLLETENYLMNKFKNVTILRFGGLYGGKRHPVMFLQGKKELTGGHAYVHLVHRDDCIRAIKSVMEHSEWGEVFNIVSDVSLSKTEYYTLMANKWGLIPPEYLVYEKSMKETQISNEKSKMKLGMTYLNPSEFYTSSV